MVSEADQVQSEERTVGNGGGIYVDVECRPRGNCKRI
jgi:hypothetical protein